MHVMCMVELARTSYLKFESSCLNREPSTTRHWASAFAISICCKLKLAVLATAVHIPQQMQRFGAGSH